jgi:hypothetical protein
MLVLWGSGAGAWRCSHIFRPQGFFILALPASSSKAAAVLHLPTCCWSQTCGCLAAAAGARARQLLAANCTTATACGANCVRCPRPTNGRATCVNRAGKYSCSVRCHPGFTSSTVDGRLTCTTRCVHPVLHSECMCQRLVAARALLQSASQCCVDMHLLHGVDRQIGLLISVTSSASF